jgi:2-polyprenyl-6-methoxyphenol hydroxylase-like FAD-dependent oxidoreductase
MDSFAEYDDKGNLKFRSDLIEKNKIWQHPWQLCNRVRLHRALHDAAVNPNQSGIPVTIVYNSKVVEVDSSAGKVKLQDGTLVKGDLIIGADGVHVCQILVLKAILRFNIPSSHTPEPA